MPDGSLVNRTFIQSFLTAEDPWCRSHGAADGAEDLVGGMLYYAIAYATKAKVCVCLGSGGGFVPRLMRQAQRDLKLENSRTILVDGSEHVDADKKKIWGSPDWVAEDSLFRKNYPDVEVVLNLTEKAFHEVLKPQELTIDYLHIDADHHYEGVKLDWDLYRTLVPDEGTITIHDTLNFREPCGVPRLIEEIRAEGEYDLVNFPIAYGTAILRKR